MKDRIEIVLNLEFNIFLLITPKTTNNIALVAEIGKFNKNKYTTMGSNDNQSDNLSLTFNIFSILFVIKKNKEI